MTTFPLRLPDDLKAAAADQAEKAGVSLNQFIAVAVAGRVGAQADAQRYMAARAARVPNGRARQILAKAGLNNPPVSGDELPEEKKPA